MPASSVPLTVTEVFATASLLLIVPSLVEEIEPVPVTPPSTQRQVLDSFATVVSPTPAAALMLRNDLIVLPLAKSIALFCVTTPLMDGLVASGAAVLL